MQAEKLLSDIQEERNRPAPAVPPRPSRTKATTSSSNTEEAGGGGAAKEE